MHKLATLLLAILLPVSAWAEDGKAGPLVIYGEDWSANPQNEVQARTSADEIARITAFMERSGIPYEFRFLPRPRKFGLLRRGTPGLYYEFLRTPSREDKYAWILPLRAGYTVEVFALKGSRACGKTLEELRDGDFVGACEAGTYACESLHGLGLAETEHIALSVTDPLALERMLMAGRIDYLVSVDSIVRRNMGELKVDRDQVQSTGVIASYDGYLIAPLGMAPDLLEKLRQTPQDDLPEVP